MITRPQSELVRIEFWELPPRAIAICLALAISPLLVFPVEFFFLLKLFACLGYRKIARMNVLDNSSRKAIYQFIRNTPGTDFSEISQKTGINQNTLRYHLAVLKLMNKVTILETSRNTRYFENSGSYTKTEQVVLKYLHNKPTRTLLQILLKNPDLTRGQLESMIGISGAGINWQIRRLSDDGLVVTRKVGRNTRYIINDEAVPHLEKYLVIYPD